MRMMGHTPKKIKPLSNEKALEIGANFLGEVMVFSSGVLVALIELTRKSFVDRKKSEKAKAEKERSKQVILRKREIERERLPCAIESTCNTASSRYLPRTRPFQSVVACPSTA
mmetsp:Transcript_3260/g.6103  ORF Transcript_3260/g.6103 Transcript_3260/m.6103 type:complete len:113 (-) Transcript_3260:465-803(-)